jgi:hypothetical protein
VGTKEKNEFLTITEKVKNKISTAQNIEEISNIIGNADKEIKAKLEKLNDLDGLSNALPLDSFKIVIVFHNIGLLKLDNLDSASIDKAIKNSPKEMITKVNNSNDSDQFQTDIFKKEDFINEFTRVFLSPYVEGKINAETDNPNRQPMIEQLLIQLEKKLNTPLSSEQKKEVEELALKAYLKLSIYEAYRYLKINRAYTRFSEQINNPENNLNTILIPALKQALKKDFPYQQFSEIEFKEKIAEAGAQYDAETQEIYEKTLQILKDHPGIGNMDDRKPKQNLLKKQEQESSAKHFLDNSSLNKEQVEAIERKHKEEMKKKLKQQQLEL